MNWAARLCQRLLNLVLVVLLGGFAAASLVRFSPGFDVDENAWNPKISAGTLTAMHALRERDNRLIPFYGHYLRAALRGDLGQSDSLRAPVAELLRDRAPVSARLAGWGTGCGLILGGAMAWLAVWPRGAAPGVFAAGVSGFLMAIPPAVLALAFFAEAPLAVAVALVLVPKVFGTARAIFRDLYSSPALLAARTGESNLTCWRFVMCLGPPRRAGWRLAVLRWWPPSAPSSPSKPFAMFLESGNSPGKRHSRATCPSFPGSP